MGLSGSDIFIAIYIFYKLYGQLIFSFDMGALKYIFTYLVFHVHPYALSSVINESDR